MKITSILSATSIVLAAVAAQGVEVSDVQVVQAANSFTASDVEQAQQRLHSLLLHNSHQETAPNAPIQYAKWIRDQLAASDSAKHHLKHPHKQPASYEDNGSGSDADAGSAGQPHHPHTRYHGHHKKHPHHHAHQSSSGSGSEDAIVGEIAMPPPDETPSNRHRLYNDQAEPETAEPQEAQGAVESSSKDVEVSPEVYSEESGDADASSVGDSSSEGSSTALASSVGDLDDSSDALASSVVDSEDSSDSVASSDDDAPEVDADSDDSSLPDDDADSEASNSADLSSELDEDSEGSEHSSDIASSESSAASSEASEASQLEPTLGAETPVLDATTDNTDAAVVITPHLPKHLRDPQPIDEATSEAVTRLADGKTRNSGNASPPKGLLASSLAAVCVLAGAIGVVAAAVGYRRVRRSDARYGESELIVDLPDPEAVGNTEDGERDEAALALEDAPMSTTNALDEIDETDETDDELLQMPSPFPCAEEVGEFTNA